MMYVQYTYAICLPVIKCVHIELRSRLCPFCFGLNLKGSHILTPGCMRDLLSFVPMVRLLHLGSCRTCSQDSKFLTGSPKEVPLLIQVAATLRNFASKEYKQFLLEDAVSSTRFRLEGHERRTRCHPSITMDG